MRCLTYNSVPYLRTSDHRPVYASFEFDLDLKDVSLSTAAQEFASTSQVCNIM